MAQQRSRNSSMQFSVDTFFANSRSERSCRSFAALILTNRGFLHTYLCRIAVISRRPVARQRVLASNPRISRVTPQSMFVLHRIVTEMRGFRLEGFLDESKVSSTRA